MSLPKDFYVVLRDDDTRFHRHTNDRDAIGEAKRLASENRTHKFFILHAFKMAREEPPERPCIEVVSTDDGIPF